MSDDDLPSKQTLRSDECPEPPDHPAWTEDVQGVFLAFQNETLLSIEENEKGRWIQSTDYVRLEERE